MAARDVALACEELALRARGGLGARPAAGRPHLQLEAALVAALAELVGWREDRGLAARLDELAGYREAVVAAAADGARGDIWTRRPLGP